MKLSNLFAILCFILLVAACTENPPPTPQNSPDETQAEETATTTSTGNYEKEDWAETDRLVWQRPQRIINLLGTPEELKNKTVADIGAGTGFFTLRLAPKVKKVIGLDIDPHFINYLDSLKVLQLPHDAQGRLEARLTPRDRPALETGEVDIVLIVNTFMYLEDKVDYLIRLKDALVEGGRIVIVDFKRKRTPFGPPGELRTPLYIAEQKLYEAGYKNIVTDDRTIDYQYIVTADR